MPVDLDVGTTSCKAERNSCQTMDDQGRHGRMVCKMGVNMGDSQVQHLICKQRRFREEGDSSEEEVGASPSSPQNYGPRLQIARQIAANKVPLSTKNA